MFDASVKWELTVWPLMDMANVAVSTPYTGPGRGGTALSSGELGRHSEKFPAV